VAAVFVFFRDGGVCAYQSEADAAGDMEGIDVDDGEYDAAYLADGTVLNIRIPQGRLGLFVLGRTDEQDRDALLERIQRYQQMNGLPVDVSDLTPFANGLIQEEWQERWPKRPRWLSSLFHGSHPKLIEPS
jgi:hypothetical protein